MNNKELLFSGDARTKLKEGVDIVANAVKVTLGPKGRNVIMDRFPLPPYITKDGVTIAKEIQLKDLHQNLGAQMLREVASKAEKGSSDGTTTATVLAQIIIDYGLQNIIARAEPTSIKKGIDKAVKEVVNFLSEFSIEIGTDNEKIKQVATVSANGDEFIGNLIAEVIKEVGINGAVMVEESTNATTTVEYIKGLSFDKGFNETSQQFVNNKNNMSFEANDVKVFVTDQKITHARDFEGILGEINNSKESLLIIASDYSDEALTILATNKIRLGLDIMAIKAPGFNENRLNMLEDITSITDGVIFNQEYSSIHKPALQFCGTAEKVIVERTSTVITGGVNSNKSKVDKRIAEAEEQLRTAKLEEVERLNVEDRLARLTGGVAIILAGGLSEVAMREVKDRIDDAVGATKSAIEEGIVPGGGVALIRAIDVLKGFSGSNKDENIGIETIRIALEQPLRQIVMNAGISPDIVIEKIKENNNPNYGFNARSEEYVDMIEDGVIDPKKVTRVALENAADIAGLFLTTECAITDDLNFE